MEESRTGKVFLSFLRFTVTFALATLVVIVVVGLLPLLVDLQADSHQLPLPAAAANVWLLAIGGIVAIVVLFLAFRAALWLYAALVTSHDLFGSVPAARLIALAIVALLFPRAVYALLTAPVVVLVQLLSDLPQSIMRFPLSSRSDETLALDEAFSRILPLLHAIGSTLGRAMHRLLDVPVVEIIVALGSWVIIGNLLSGPRGEAPRSGAGWNQVRLISYWRGLSDRQRRNVGIGAVFFVGIYLSIAAIVAIPWLNEEKVPQNITREQLQKALQPFIPQATAAADTKPAALPDPFQTVSDIIDERTKKGEELPEQVWMQLRDVRSSVEFAKRKREFALAQARTLRDEVARRNGEIVNEALAAFDAEMLSPMSGQERVVFFRDILRSVQSQVSNMRLALAECERSIADMDRQFELLSRELVSAVTRAEATPGSVAGTRMEAAAMIGPVACARAPTHRLQYSIPEPGTGWGPFALVAQWLLRTKSHALALITGMLGFGLLGSAIATFVRAPAGGSRQTTLPGEVSILIVRGLSAAIVIFLAVKGGLAVFSTGETELNAYVLFFTCLVGAVFSEDVWLWAREKFGQTFPGDPSSSAKEKEKDDEARGGAPGEAARADLPKPGGEATPEADRPR